MSPRIQRPPAGAASAASRGPVAPVHRGPQALGPSGPYQHAPNAALLIDFDNVTMGIRSDLASELRHLLASDIIKGKVAVQRAYADWRRYPQYIVPLAESSIDMIMAPAYGSSKKNATDIRLAVDAMELVFTRPEIGTFILLSGDSDFASLVTKLKEYGKYVIGVGIRESSSDLLVMNCDEYYSYNALAGLVKTADEEIVRKDPWELVVEAMERMVQNDDVMRSDRLKQVMQDIDPSFDEKDLGYPKFSRFAQDAAARGLITLTRMENGQYEVGPVVAPAAAPAAERPRREAADAGRAAAADVAPAREEERADRDGRRRRRGRRGRGDREDRGAPEVADAGIVETVAPEELEPVEEVVIGRSGERLTRAEAFDLVRRAAESLVQGDDAARARDVRVRAFELLGRDSESLSERNFPRILKDAHDAGLIDLRRRGDDYEVSLPSSAAPIADQLNQAAAATRAAEPTPPPAPRGVKTLGIISRGRGRSATPPPDLFSVGVVDDGSWSTGVLEAEPMPAEPDEPQPLETEIMSEPVAEAAGERASAAKTATKRAGRKGARKAAAKTAAKTAAKKTATKRAARKTAAKSATKTAAKTAARAASGASASATPRKRATRGARKSAS